MSPFVIKNTSRKKSASELISALADKTGHFTGDFDHLFQRRKMSRLDLGARHGLDPGVAPFLVHGFARFLYVSLDVHCTRVVPPG